jgi:hypothetical protein
LPEFSNKRKQDFNTKQDTWPNKTPRYSVNNNMNTNNNLSNDSRRSGFSVMAKISLTDGKMSGLILSDLIELIKDAKAFCKYKTEMIPIQAATCPWKARFSICFKGR